MADPYGITQVNVPGLLQMYEGVKRTRLDDMYRQKQVERQDVAWKREDEAYGRDQKKREDLTAAYDPNTGKLDTGKVRKAFLGAGDIEGVLNFDDKELQRQADELKTYQAINQAAINLMSGVRDQASYDMAKQQAKVIYDRYGHPFPELPPVYDPKTVEQLQLQALSAKERLDYGLRQATIEEQRRANKAREGISASGLALRERAENRVAKWGPQPLIGMMPGGAPSGTDDLDY